MWQDTNSTGMAVGPTEKSSQIRRVKERVKEARHNQLVLSKSLSKGIAGKTIPFSCPHRFSMHVSLGGNGKWFREAELIMFLSPHPVKTPEVVYILLM